MKNAMTRFRRSIVLTPALAFAACAGDDVSGPQSGGSPQLNSEPTLGLVLAKIGPAGTTATFSIVAIGGNLPVGSTVTLNGCPNDGTIICETATAWTPSNNDWLAQPSPKSRRRGTPTSARFKHSARWMV